MHQPRTHLGKAMSKGRNRRRPPNPEIDTAPSSRPLDALVRGLIFIGDKTLKGRPPMLRIP